MQLVSQQMLLNVLVNTIVSQYFHNPPYVVYQYDKEDNFIQIENVINVISFGINENRIAQYKYCEYFVLHTNNASITLIAIDEILRIRTLTQAIRKQRKYIIIIEDQSILDQFYSLNLLRFLRDILVVHIHDSNNHVYHLYTHRFIGSEPKERVLLDVWYGSNRSFQDANNLFPDKATNQQGRVLRVGCFNWIPFGYCTEDVMLGTDGEIIVKYAKRFNMTINMMPQESCGINYLNFTGTPAVFSLLVYSEEYLDVVIGGCPFRVLTDEIEYNRFTLIPFVPIPKVKYGFTMFLEGFNLSVWTCILLVFLSVRVAFYIHPSRIQVNSLNIFALFLSQSVKLPTSMYKSNFHKFVVILTAILSVLLVTAYNSRLSSIMAQPTLENDIRSLKELADSDLGFLFMNDYYFPFYYDERPVFKKLLSKVTAIDETADEKGAIKMINSKKYALPQVRMDNGKYFMTSLYVSILKDEYKPIYEKIYYKYTSIHLRQHSVHTNELTKLIKQATEAGLNKIWLDQALRFTNIDYVNHFREYKLVIHPELHFEQLKGLFVLWFVGLAFATFVFIVERFVIQENN